VAAMLTLFGLNNYIVKIRLRKKMVDDFLANYLVIYIKKEIIGNLALNINR